MPTDRLTETKLKSLVNKPSLKRVELHDTMSIGLSIRITPRGTATWTYRFRVRGEGGITARGHAKKGMARYRVTLGRYPAVSLAAARLEAARLAEMSDRGENPLREIERGASITVRELANKFIEQYIERDKIRAKTKYISSLETHVIPNLGRYPAQTVMPKDIASMLSKVQKKRTRGDGKVVGGPESARTALTVIQKMYNWGKSLGYVEITTNPAHGIGTNVLPSPQSKDRNLTVEEARAVMQASAEFDNVFYSAFYRLMLLTGCRPHEWLDCRWDDIDLEQAVMVVPRTKKDRVKIVPLVDSAIQILESLPRVDDHVLGKITRSSKTLDRLRSDANQVFGSEMEHWTNHDLRRTVASRLAELGVSDKFIKRILDHQEGGATAIYNRYQYVKECREALELWAKELN